MKVTELYKFLAIGDDIDELVADLLCLRLRRNGYHSIFEGSYGKVAWGNDPGEPKWPLSEGSRRIVLTDSNWAIVRGPSAWRTKDDRIFGWAMVDAGPVRTLEDFVTFLSLPRLGVLRPARSTSYA